VSAGVLGAGDAGRGTEPVRLTLRKNWLQIFRRNPSRENNAGGS